MGLIHGYVCRRPTGRGTLLCREAQRHRVPRTPLVMGALGGWRPVSRETVTRRSPSTGCARPMAGVFGLAAQARRPARVSNCGRQGGRHSSEREAGARALEDPGSGRADTGFRGSPTKPTSRPLRSAASGVSRTREVDPSPWCGGAQSSVVPRVTRPKSSHQTPALTARVVRGSSARCSVVSPSAPRTNRAARASTWTRANSEQA